VHVAGRRLALEVDLESALGAGPAHVVLRFAKGGRIDVRVDAEGGGRAQLRALSPGDVASAAGPLLPELVKAMRSYKPGGTLDGEFEWTAAVSRESRLAARGRLAGGLFGSADGLLAAEDLDIEFAL